MEELLQLEVVIPGEPPDEIDPPYDGGFDDVHDIIWNNFPVPNKGGQSYDQLGITLASSLFERRSDNLEAIDEIEAQLREWYPDASIYRSSCPESFGEFRSFSDPDRRIVLLVTNWGVDQPTIRWKQEKETLQAPPLVNGDKIYHGNTDGIFAIDGSSGDVQWENECGHIVQVPVGNDNKIIGNTGLDLVAIERSTGDVEWRTEFDFEQEEIIDSRVALGTESAYVGLRTGDVVAISLSSGDWEKVCEFDSPVVGLQMIEPGLIATTNKGEVSLVDSGEKTVWPEDVDVTPSILYSQDGTMYGYANGSLIALSEEDGIIQWQIDFPAVKEVIQTGETLVAAVPDGLIAVNTETGNRVWGQSLVDDYGTVSNPVVVDGVLTCVTSKNYFDEEYYPFDRNILHIFDPSDGTELRQFELGVGDGIGPAVVGDAIVLSAGGEMICLENFPDQDSDS